MSTTSKGSRSKRARGPVLGLTGGTGSGKSTVAAAFARLGARVISADALAREVVAPGTPGLAGVVARFGAEYLAPDGTLDRKKLGRHVFADPAERRALEGIVLPRIREAFEAALDRIRAEAPDAVVVYDAPILIEAGAHKAVDRVVVVRVDEQTQVGRLMARDGLSETQARARIGAQMPMAERLGHADEIVDGTLPPDRLEARLKEVLAAARHAA